MASSINRNLIFPFLALAAALMACGLGNSIQSNPSQPSANSPTQPSANNQTQPAASTQPNSPPALPGDPRSLVANAITTLTTVPYRKNEWFTDSLGYAPDTNNLPDLVAEFAPPNNSYVVWGGREYLALNGSSYSRKTGEAWAKDMPGSISKPAVSAMASMMNDALNSKTLNFQFAGNETVIGVPCQAVRIDGTIDTPDGQTVQISAKVWVGGDGRLVKMELDNPDNGTAFDVSTYEYNVTIQMPAP